MQQPNIRSSLFDQNTRATYHVLAYRELTRQELLQTIGAYLSQKKVKKPKPGASITIITIIGFND